MLINTTQFNKVPFAKAAPLSNELNFSNTLGLSGTLFSDGAIRFSEQLALSGVPSSAATFDLRLFNRLNLTSKSGLGLVLILLDNILRVDDLSFDRVLLVQLLEKLVLAAQSGTQQDGMLHLIASFFETDFLKAGFSANFLSALLVADILSSTHAQILSLLDTLVVLDSPALQGVVRFEAVESFVMADALSNLASLGLLFVDELFLGSGSDTPDNQYAAWVINAESKAMSRYDNYPFNSFAKIKGAYYGADSTGLYFLGGASDDGVPIDAKITTGLLHFGSTLLKQIPRAYIGYTADGKLLLNTITTETGNKIERWYELKERVANDTTHARVKLARGVKSVYWQFEIINIDGAGFALDEIKLLPVIFKRRV